MSKYILRIKQLNNENFYQNSKVAYTGDSGIDLYIPEDIKLQVGTTLVDLKIQCEMILRSDGSNVSYYLYPRSSIYKKDMLMHNSVGIIDSMYRGNIKVPLRAFSEIELLKGERYVQICSPDLSTISVEIVDNFITTERGTAGFGSSGL